jgi:UDP-sulfoquinovose synthase
MKICILGADGYYGYALKQRLSAKHTLLNLDNFWRRNLTWSPSLTPLHSIDNITECDVRDYDKLFYYLNNFKPDYVIHLAEQRSAPYSMKGIQEKHFTLTNNITTSINVMECAKILKFKTIHIGSMGVYGYDKKELITEGDSIRSPGSIYHLSKVLDNNIFELYNRLYECDIIELHQGIIWGIGGRFDYDAVFGTVINRFLVQSMLDIPLTLYGSGNQERSIINIKNSLDCIELILKANLTGFHTFNQYTQILKLVDIAKIVSKSYLNISNPRIENEKNKLISSNKKLLNLGLNPIYLNKNAITNLLDYLNTHKNNVDHTLINPNITW